MKNIIKAGFVGFGEVNTPKEIIESKCAEAVSTLESLGIEVKKAPSVSDDQGGLQAAEASKELLKYEFDFLVVCLAGWIPSWAVIKTIERFKNTPILLWGVTGDFVGERFVTAAAQAGTTALRQPMEDMGFCFRYIVTPLGENAPEKEILSFAKAAFSCAALKKARIGMAGYRDMRLYGTLYDAVSVKATFGTEVEHFELMELFIIMENISEIEEKEAVEYMSKNWVFKGNPARKTLSDTARLFVALKKKAEERNYLALSYNDVDGIKKLMKFAPAGALTLLHDRMEICSIPENDSMGALTQLATFFMTGEIPAYLEFYEFTKKGALMGVPDYVPANIVDGKITVMPNAFGEFGEGLLNISKIRTGKVTIARIGMRKNGYIMHVACGEARTPLKWEEAGWAPPAPQLPSLKICFEAGPENFIQNVLSQHYILSYGDRTQDYRNLCSILGITLIEHK